MTSVIGTVYFVMLIWIYAQQHTTAKGIIGATSQNGPSAQKAKPYTMEGLVETWHKGKHSQNPTSALWNPMLVKLINRYLISHRKPSSSNTFTRAFKHLSMKKTKLQPDKHRKKHKEQMLVANEGDFRVRFKRFAELGQFNLGDMKHFSERLIGKQHQQLFLLPKQSTNGRMLPEEVGGDDQSVDFTIPLHNNIGFTETADNMVNYFEPATITNNHRVKRNIFSSLHGHQDPFHPLAYPIKNYGKSKRSNVYPLPDSAYGYYTGDPLYNRKRGQYTGTYSGPKSYYSKTSGASRLDGQRNLDFYQYPFTNENFKYNNKGDFGFSNFKMDPSLYPQFGEEAKNLYGDPEKNNFVPHERSDSIDFKSLLSMYSNLLRNTGATGVNGNTRGINPTIDDGGLDPRAALTEASIPITVAVTQQFVPVTQGIVPTTEQTPIAAPRTRDPCDEMFTSESHRYGVSKKPCYYMPPTTQAPNSIATTMYYDNYGTHDSHLHYHVPGLNPAYTTTPSDETIWSEFEIVQEGLWETKSPKPIINEHTHREFLITTKVPDLSRFKITDRPPYVETLPKEYAEMGLPYPTKLRKKPRITGTIVLRREKNNKPKYVVKLPFDTGQLPFAIRRLIISKFTDPSKDSHSPSSVTLSPNCPPWNTSCSSMAKIGLSADRDVIIEVDPSLFDKAQFYKAYQDARKKGRTALDLEELIPKWRREELIGINQERPQEHTQQGYNIEKLSDNKMMSPSTQSPIDEEFELPAETPEWLRNIINQFTKKENWGKNENENKASGSVIARLLPATEPNYLDNHIEVLPRHMALSSQGTIITKPNIIFVLILHVVTQVFFFL